LIVPELPIAMKTSWAFTPPKLTAPLFTLTHAPTPLPVPSCRRQLPMPCSFEVSDGTSAVPFG
jgi:hypothetical protein